MKIRVRGLAALSFFAMTLVACGGGNGGSTSTPAPNPAPSPAPSVPSAPTASFTTTVTSGTAPLTVGFTDTSSGTPTSWSWNFGDSGATSTSKNVTHMFTTAGTYTVHQTVTNAADSDSASTVITVSASLPQSNTPHPRLFLTSTVMAALQAKVAANDADWLALKARADTLLTYSIPAYDPSAWPNNTIPYAYEGGQWLEAAQVLGLAYKASGNAAYAAKLKTLINVINAAGVAPIKVDVGYPSRNVAFAMALMYDWLYDYLDSTTKASMVTTINAYYASFVNGSGWYEPLVAYDNYFGGHILGFGTCALATNGDNPTAPAMLADIRGKWDSTIPAAFTTGGFTGGEVVESYNYGPNHYVRLLSFAIALQTATGEDIYSSYGAKIAKNLMYNLKPNRWQSTDEGDMAGDYTGVMPANLPIVLAGFTAGTYGDQMAYFYSHLATPPDSGAAGAQQADSFTRLLFKSSRTQTDYRTVQPQVYRSPGDEHVFIRSDWSDNAVWSSYMAGNIKWAGHETMRAGHIAIQRGNDYLLVNSGQWKGQDGVSGQPQNFNGSSKWTNTLFFNDGGDYLYGGGASTGQYAGGQMSGFADQNVVLAYETAANYTYVKADHTNAYDIRDDSRNAAARTMRYFNRNFVKLGDKTFVVYDRIKALKATYPKILYWHLNENGLPTAVVANTTSSTVGSSRLFIKAVYPTTATVTLARDINEQTSAPTTARVEIADSISSTDFNPLTVLVADSSTSSMPATTGIDAAVAQGVLIGSTTPQVVLFSKDGTAQNDVTYTASYSASITGNHLLVDLQPGTYRIFRDSSQIGTAVASSQGVLSFSASGGTQFEVKF